MRLPDRFSFRQKPSGAFRLLLRIPVHLFRWRLGFLFGERLLLVMHLGRRSGRRYEIAIEVVDHDRDGHEYIVCSGTLPHADWYANLRRSPAVAVQVRNTRWVPMQRFLDDNEAAQRFHAYEQTHPRTARRLLASMGNTYDGTDEDRVQMMAAMPMVAFTDYSPSPTP